MLTRFVDDLTVSPDGRSLVAGHSGFPGIGNRTDVYDIALGARRWRHVVDGDVQSVHLIGNTVWSGFHDGGNGDVSTITGVAVGIYGAVRTQFSADPTRPRYASTARSASTLVS